MTDGNIVTILAGGRSRRMPGSAKALTKIDGERLVDCVIARVRDQTDEILLSASQDYETGLPVIEDEVDALAGPVAGLWTIARWVGEHRPTTKAFVSVPVDAPCLPLNLIEQLKQPEGTAIAQTSLGLQPTFGYWDVENVFEVLSAPPPEETLSLRELASRCNATCVFFADSGAFANINTPEDVRRLENQLRLADHRS